MTYEKELTDTYHDFFLYLTNNLTWFSNKRRICHFEGAALIRGRRLIEGGAYLIFVVLGAALIRGRRLLQGGA